MIAAQYGLPWKKIWDHPQNKALSDLRKSPNILYPGDELFIPEIELRYEDCPTETLTQFKWHSAQNKLHLVLRDEWDKPLKNISYTLHIRGRSPIEKKTGSDGLIEAEVPEDIDSVRLIVKDLNMHLDLMVGHLDPVSRITGVQQRLNSLGFNCGAVDGIVGPATRAALQRFQAWAGVKQTGVADSRTRQELEKAHDGLSRGAEIEDSTGTAPEPVAVEGEPGRSDPTEAQAYDADHHDSSEGVA